MSTSIREQLQGFVTTPLRGSCPEQPEGVRKLVEYIKERPGVTHKQMAVHFQVDPGTIALWLKEATVKYGVVMEKVIPRKYYHKSTVKQRELQL